MNESLKDFTERMSKVPKEWEHQVGRAYQGNSRAGFVFEGQHCYLESDGYRRVPKSCVNSASREVATRAIGLAAVFSPPSDAWWTDYMSYGRERAERIAKRYGATLWEAVYAQEEGKWFHYWFDEDEEGGGFERLMKFVHDRLTGVFLDEFGPEPELYRSCIDDGAEPVEVA